MGNRKPLFSLARLAAQRALTDLLFTLAFICLELLQLGEKFFYGTSNFI